MFFVVLHAQLSPRATSSHTGQSLISQIDTPSHATRVRLDEADLINTAERSLHYRNNHRKIGFGDLLDVEGEREEVEVFDEFLDLAAPEVLECARVGGDRWFEKGEDSVGSEPADAVQ